MEIKLKSGRKIKIKADISLNAPLIEIIQEGRRRAAASKRK